MALLPCLCPDGQAEPVGLVGHELGTTTLQYFKRFRERERPKRTGTSPARTGAVGCLAGGILSNPGGAKKRWPAETKAAALERCAVVGPGRTSREMNISENTLKSWMSRASAKAHRELARADLVMPVRTGLGWAARRSELLSAMGELAAESVAASRLAVQENRSKCASDFANVASRMIDKCALLGGDVTSRSESRSLSVHVDAEKQRALQEEIDELERELEVERKELGDGGS